MTWKDGLTDEQQKAASHTGSHARLLAGPGTGKTFTLTRRIVRLVVDLKKPAGSILAFTFTKFAAAELRKRVAAEVNSKDEKQKKNKPLPRISTLHSYALIPNYRSPLELRTIGKNKLLSFQKCKQ